jgi:transposase
LTKSPAIPRRRGERSPGKQPGSPGAFLSQVADQDEVVDYQPTSCVDCGRSLERATVVGHEVRQVFDIPHVQLEVAEHRAQVRRCSCGCDNVASFPAEVGAPTQYGARLRALAVVLVVQQHLPLRRTAEVLSDVCGATISAGTILTWVRSVAEESVAPAVDEVAALLHAADVLHVDETGARVNGKLGWVHSAGTAGATHYSFHRRRGGEGTRAGGVVPDFGGVLVHDGWAAYRGFGTTHALCNAHHLRELRALEERGQRWPAQLRTVLLDALDQVHQNRGQPLSVGRRSSLVRRYRAGLCAGQAEWPTHERVDPVGARKAKNLLHRLTMYEADVLRFTTDPDVPFTNNAAERDIRMVKLQQKISGCRRTERGIRAFLSVRSYLSTLRKNDVNPLRGLQLAMAGTPWLPTAGV